MKKDAEYQDGLKEAKVSPEDEARAFGSLMRAARERSGFSVERVAMATRISQSFIESLEAGDIAKLPGAVFARGFIRNLCRSYGEDSRKILEAFESLTKSPQGFDGVTSSRDDKKFTLPRKLSGMGSGHWTENILSSRNFSHYFRPKPTWVFGIIGAGAVLILFMTNFSKKNFQSKELAKQKASQSVGETSVNSSQGLEPGPSAAPQVPQDMTDDPSKVGELGKIEIQVKKAASVTIQKDADPELTQNLQVGSHRYEFRHQFMLHVANMGAVEIYFQGQRVAAAAAEGESRRLKFTTANDEIATKKPSQAL